MKGEGEKGQNLGQILRQAFWPLWSWWRFSKLGWRRKESEQENKWTTRVACKTVHIFTLQSSSASKNLFLQPRLHSNTLNL